MAVVDMPTDPAMTDDLYVEIRLARLVHHAAQDAHAHSPNGKSAEAVRVAEVELNKLLERLLSRRMKVGS